MKKGLMILVVLLVCAMALGAAFAFSTPGNNKGAPQSPLTSEVWENNTKLLKVSEKLVEANLTSSGIPLAGYYIDAQTCTLYVGLTEIGDKHTEPIKAIINKVERVNLEFFKASFTEVELRSLQRKIEKAFLGIDSMDMERLYDIQDESLREASRKELREKIQRTRKEENVPITLIGVDIKNNRLTVGLKEIKPQYVEEIRKVVGSEVPIEFIEGEIKSDSTRTSRHRPLFGGIQLWSRALSGMWGTSTLGFRATHSDGTVGFVMSGHCGVVGTDVWQPSQQTNNLVGRVRLNPSGPRSSDAAFVPTTDIIPVIWPQRPIAGWLSTSYTPPGTVVSMGGIITLGQGFIRATGVTVPHFNYTTLWSQVLATYPSANGDSGAPVFGLDGGFNAIIYGIHAGRLQEFAAYSPVEGIWWDLWVRWGS